MISAIIMQLFVFLKTAEYQLTSVLEALKGQQ